jgi:SAM-dependent methyltransferase
MRDVHLGRRFDVVQALFHVVSYLETDEDLERAFACVREHLEPGGLFLFDCWHGAGVLSDPPAVRVLERRDGNLRVWRTAVPKVEADRDVVQVDYTILVADGFEAPLREIRESHRMRYFFLPELHRLLLRAGMRVVDAHPSWHPGRAIGLGDWYLTIVARAEGENQETTP